MVKRQNHSLNITGGAMDKMEKGLPRCEIIKDTKDSKNKHLNKKYEI